MKQLDEMEEAVSARHRHHKKRIRECESELGANAALQDATRLVMSHLLETGHDKLSIAYHTLEHVLVNLERANAASCHGRFESADSREQEEKQMPEKIDKEAAIKVAAEPFEFLDDEEIEENLDFAGCSIAEAYQIGAEEAQREIVARLRALKSEEP